MSNLVFDVLPLLLLSVVLIGIKPVCPITNINDDYLSVDTVRNLKGILAVVVVFHHLAMSTNGGFLIRLFYNAGYFAVSTFFFFSGYGLQKSYMMKKDQYRKKFLGKRIPTVLFPYVIVTIICWLAFYADGEVYSFMDIIVAFGRGTPIVPNSWYVITILLFYLAFWLLMIMCNNHYLVMAIGGFVWYVLYIVCCMKLGFHAYWYNSCHLLLIGMLWAVFEPKIKLFIVKYHLVTPLVWLLFIILLGGKLVFLPDIPNELISLFVNVVISTLFVISLILLSSKLRIGNKITGFLGQISFEIYLIHGLFMKLLRGHHIYIHNEVVWSVLVLILTIVFSWLLHLLLDVVLKQYKKILT